ncbi:hypothetical protein C5F48_23600 [Cereibacter changlensis JA139]|uniref:Uncharacterized protein n=2 Tax=Cereibacter changlensis TaxID=402884 RepID=A0A2T4JL55_9RHOB|nr:hypothetical protein [Cereibacter changlensis]PTE18602.1 hypothetical protein C5F48_23600 [Cereibacter changlensis JA139]PZX46952.1 hypothetical protein LX76_04583 [Cereibacter changlensis]
MASIPVTMKKFRKYVEEAGFLDVSVVYADGDRRRGGVFTLTTRDRDGNKIFLYSTARPEPRRFTDVARLTSTLSEWGLQALELPVTSGTHRCHLAGVCPPPRLAVVR